MGISLNSFLRKKNSLFLSLLPVIMAYKTPGLEIGLSTFFIIVFFFDMVIYTLLNFSSRSVKIIWPLFLYLIYVLIRSVGLDALLPVIVLIYVLAFSSGAAECSFLRSLIEVISCVASFSLFFQTIVHAIWGVHIPMIDSNLILTSLNKYYSAINSGYSEVSRMYRPCAFFLEPAHFTQYCIIGLGSSLYRNKKARSILITLGVLLTTSGFGFVLTFVVWSWWYVSNNGIHSLQKRVKKIIALVMVVPPLIFMMSLTSFFGNVISRFITTESSGNYNAIDGRLFYWNTFVKGLSWDNIFVGLGADQLPDCYFTGFMRVVYAYGIIGLFLLLLSYILFVIKGKELTRFFSIMYIGLLFFANLTHMINLIFTFGVVLTLYYYDDFFGRSAKKEIFNRMFDLSEKSSK